MRRCGALAVALALAASTLALAAPVRAAEHPLPGLTDARIRKVFYNPDDVVDLTGYLGFQTMIEFGPDERIENVSIGDATAWQITPNKRATLLFLKPLEVAAPTNMTVVTDQRSYAFELSVRRTRSPRPADVAYVIRFTYPPLPKMAAARVAAPPPLAAPAARNTAYTYTGSRASLPSAVFDDGRFTYFRWPDNVSIPALFLLGKDGTESLANYSERDGYQVVEQVAPRFVLRNGKDVTIVINEAWRAPAPGPLAPAPHDAKTARDAARDTGRP
jgi:type IV secretion system protein VirB9